MVGLKRPRLGQDSFTQTVEDANSFVSFAVYICIFFFFLSLIYYRIPSLSSRNFSLSNFHLHVILLIIFRFFSSPTLFLPLTFRMFFFFSVSSIFLPFYHFLPPILPFLSFFFQLSLLSFSLSSLTSGKATENVKGRMQQPR